MQILSLDVGGTAIKAAMFDAASRLSAYGQTPSHALAHASLEENAVAVAKRYAGYDAVGIALTGQIDQERQILYDFTKKAPAEDLIRPVGSMLAQAIGKPVFLLNDANAATLGEARFGAGRGYADFLCLTYGTGVGCGIILDNRLLLGARGIAGEVGHMVVHVGGRRACACGHRGCYQQYAATTALLRRARSAVPAVRDGHELFARAPESAALRRIIRLWVNEVVEGLCTLCYVFNPPCVVLGGGIMERPDVIEMVRERFQARIISSFADTRIVSAALGNKAALYGAYVFAAEQMEARSQGRNEK